jgi:hypothetical protein
VLILAASFFITLAAMDFFAPLCPQGSRTALSKPFSSAEGFAYLSDLPGLDSQSDTAQEPRRSRAVLCEDGYRIGPAHMALDDIRKTGKGRFTHFGPVVVFSAPDNSNPNLNGRSYSLVLPIPPG